MTQVNGRYLWVRNRDERHSAPLVRDHQPVHGGKNKDHHPVWIETDGKRLDVVQELEWWSATEVAEDMRHAVVCRMSDDSLWCLVVDASTMKKWTGARLPDGWTSPP